MRASSPVPLGLSKRLRNPESIAGMARGPAVRGRVRINAVDPRRPAHAVRVASAQRAVRAPFGNGGQRGFTLVEVLLALSLCVLLMAAVYMSFNWYERIATGRSIDVERSQIARAAYAKIAADVRSVVFRDPALNAADEGLDFLAEDDPEAAPVEVEVIDPAQAFAGTARGIVGDSGALVLHVSRPPRGMSFAAGDAAIGTSDLLSVSYFLADARAAGLPGEAARIAAGRVSAPAGFDGTGLARLSGDRMAMDTADALADGETLARSVEILAPEINFLQFRYFDGVVWLDAWDSSQLGQLPQAIEIVIGFRRSGGDAEGGSTDLRRYVVGSPMSEPVVDAMGVLP